MIELDFWKMQLWAVQSRKGEVCGIFQCNNKPVVQCKHCGGWYCKEHKSVLSIPTAHLVKEGGSNA